MTLRKKSGSVSSEKEYSLVLRKELSDEGFRPHRVEQTFGRGFPDIIALRKCTWFIELKWLRNVTSSDDAELRDKLLEAATVLQKQWLKKESESTHEIDGKQVYALVGGYYEGDTVKHALIHYINGSEKYVFVADFDVWGTLDEMWSKA
jgi:hypothetical protein